jgi:hypothetical protein
MMANPESQQTTLWSTCADSLKLHQALIISRKAQHGPDGLGFATLVLKDPQLGDGLLWVYKAGPLGSRLS